MCHICSTEAWEQHLGAFAPTEFDAETETESWDVLTAPLVSNPTYHACTDALAHAHTHTHTYIHTHHTHQRRRRDRD